MHDGEEDAPAQKEGIVEKSPPSASINAEAGGSIASSNDRSRLITTTTRLVKPSAERHPNLAKR